MKGGASRCGSREWRRCCCSSSLQAALRGGCRAAMLLDPPGSPPRPGEGTPTAAKRQPLLCLCQGITTEPRVAPSSPAQRSAAPGSHAQPRAAPGRHEQPRAAPRSPAQPRAAPSSTAHTATRHNTAATYLTRPAWRVEWWGGGLERNSAMLCPRVLKGLVAGTRTFAFKLFV